MKTTIRIVVFVLLASVLIMAQGQPGLLITQRPQPSQLTEEGLFAQLGRCNSSIELRVKDLNAQDIYIKQLEARIADLESRVKPPTGNQPPNNQPQPKGN